MLVRNHISPKESEGSRNAQTRRPATTRFRLSFGKRCERSLGPEVAPTNIIASFASRLLLTTSTTPQHLHLQIPSTSRRPPGHTSAIFRRTQAPSLTHSIRIYTRSS